jgi:hypothetical protein
MKYEIIFKLAFRVEQHKAPRGLLKHFKDILVVCGLTWIEEHTPKEPSSKEIGSKLVDHSKFNDEYMCQGGRRGGGI